MRRDLHKVTVPLDACIPLLVLATWYWQRPAAVAGATLSVGRQLGDGESAVVIASVVAGVVVVVLAGSLRASTAAARRAHLGLSLRSSGGGRETQGDNSRRPKHRIISCTYSVETRTTSLSHSSTQSTRSLSTLARAFKIHTSHQLHCLFVAGVPRRIGTRYHVARPMCPTRHTLRPP